MTFPTQWENNPNVPNHRPDMHSQLNGKIKFMFQTTNHCHMNVVFIGNNNPSNPSRSPIYVRKYPCSSLFGIFWDCYYNNIILYHSHNLPMIAEQHFFLVVADWEQVTSCPSAFQVKLKNTTVFVASLLWVKRTRNTTPRSSITLW